MFVKSAIFDLLSAKSSLAVKTHSQHRGHVSPRNYSHRLFFSLSPTSRAISFQRVARDGRVREHCSLVGEERRCIWRGAKVCATRWGIARERNGLSRRGVDAFRDGQGPKIVIDRQHLGLIAGNVNNIAYPTRGRK